MRNHLVKLYGLFLAIAALAAFSAPPVFAQTGAYVFNYTTLSAAVTASTTTFPLTSTSARTGSTSGAPAAGQCAFVGNELVRIVSISGSNATVTRDTQNPASHASGATIFTGACAQLKLVDPPFASGGLNCAQQPLPWINTSNGNIWVCRSAAWTATNVIPITYNSAFSGY